MKEDRVKKTDVIHPNVSPTRHDHKAGNRLEAETKKFEILSKAINDAIFDWNIVDGTVDWNQGLFAIYGYDPEKHPHNIECWKNNLHPEEKAEVLNDLQKTFEDKKENWNSIYRYKCKNNTYKFTYDRAFIVYDGVEPVRMIGAMQDIDERMVALREIEKLSLVASNTDNLVVITDADEKIEWVNHGFIKRTGYLLHEVIGKTPRFLQGAETDRSALKRISTSLKNGKPITEEILNYTRDGAKFWIKININPVFDAANRLVKFVAVETDITPLKEYERKVTAIARDLTNLIATANAPVFGLDRHGNINEWNNRAMELTGFTGNEVINQRFIDILVHKSSRETTAEKLEAVYGGRPFSNLEVPVVTKDQKRIVILLNATPRKNANDEIESLFLVGQDITEFTLYRQSLEERVKERTEELQIALEKEKELVTIKSRFASIVSHEFRTPLSTISVSASHIKKFRSRLQPEEIDKKLDVIQEQISHMTRLLEDVLTIGKSESGKIQMTKKELNICQLIMKIREDVENQFKNTHTITCSLDILQEEVVCDEGLLRNIFVNLFSNAIKFSPGKNNVSVTAHEGKDHLQFEISDNGIGIPEADQQRVFSPFDRGTNASTIPGTGLGLSIVKKAVDMVGGSITLRSEAGKGSVFTVTIPVK